MATDNAHIEARELILEQARKLAKSSDNVLATFAGAVREYLVAEALEPCLHLHSGQPADTCANPLVKCGRKAGEHVCSLEKGHSGPHYSGAVARL